VKGKTLKGGKARKTGKSGGKIRGKSLLAREKGNACYEGDAGRGKRKRLRWASTFIQETGRPERNTEGKEVRSDVRSHWLEKESQRKKKK